MNGIALISGLLYGGSVFSLILGFKHFKRRASTSIDKFKPYVDYQREEDYKKYEKIINRSKVPFKKALALIILGGIAIGVTVYVIIGVWWIALLSFLGGFLFPKWWYEWHQNSKQSLILKQMEIATEIMGSVLNTGSSLPEALERASIEVKEPLRAELVRTATQIRVGVSSSVAFMELTQRLNISEMSVISIAIDLQETGMAINIPKLFMQLQGDIRNKIQFTKELQSTTAEIKMAGYIVAVMPFAVISIVRIFAPDFISPMFSNPLGLFVFCVSSGIILCGLKWMLNMAKLEA